MIKSSNYRIYVTLSKETLQEIDKIVAEEHLRSWSEAARILIEEALEVRNGKAEKES